MRRFEEQRNRREQLESMKSTNEKRLQALEEEKHKLLERFRELEYTQKLRSSGQKEVVEESIDDDDEESDYKKKIYER